MVMGKQAFVKAYACFQTTASPRPFDYEYINIRLLPQQNCKWADQILDRHLLMFKHGMAWNHRVTVLGVVCGVFIYI